MGLRERVIWYLERQTKPIPAHELRDLLGDVNDNNLCSRLCEFARDGLVIGEKAEGKAYKVWRIVRADKQGQIQLI